MMKKMMFYLGLTVVSILCLLFLIGLFLPKERVFVKNHTFNAPISSVFQTVTDFKNQASWRSDVKEIKVIDDKTWTEIPHKGTPITFQIQSKIDNQLFEIVIIEPTNFKGYWVGKFKNMAQNRHQAEGMTEGGTTAVEFKEVVTVANPMFRTLSFLFVDLNKTMDIYGQNLKLKLEK